MIERQLNTNFRIMEQIRARVDAIVKDPKTAAALKPYYAYGCKRPTFHDEYLPSFNLPHVHLVDTAPQGVSRINERGVVHDGVEYPRGRADLRDRFPMDGHSHLQYDHRSERYDACGRSGSRKAFALSWALHSHGFPNLFIMSGPQSGGAQFNFTRGLEGHTDYVVWLLKTLREKQRRHRGYPQGAGRRPMPNIAARPIYGPDRYATACPITTATATRNQAALPITAVRRNGTKFARRHRRRLIPYVFEPGPETERRAPAAVA